MARVKSAVAGEGGGDHQYKQEEKKEKKIIIVYKYPYMLVALVRVQRAHCINCIATAACV